MNFDFKKCCMKILLILVTEVFGPSCQGGWWRAVAIRAPAGAEQGLYFWGAGAPSCGKKVWARVHVTWKHLSWGPIWLPQLRSPL